MLRTMSENGVNYITDLRVVKSQAAHFRARMGTQLTYEQYFSPLLSAVSAYDSQFFTCANSKGIQRNVYTYYIYNDNNQQPYYTDNNESSLDINYSNIHLK